MYLKLRQKCNREYFLHFKGIFTVIKHFYLIWDIKSHMVMCDNLCILVKDLLKRQIEVKNLLIRQLNVKSR